MEEKVFNAALAGLLHDIGKFAVRAGERGSRTWDEQARGDYKYLHALLTEDFIRQYVPAPWQEAVKYAAANHHRPERRAELITALADHLSAGERTEPPDDSRAVQPRQLLSVFCSLTADGQSAPGQRYWPLTILDLQTNSNPQTLFPQAELPEAATWQTYERLWRGFCLEAGQLRDRHTPDGAPEAYLESLLLLLQRYTWCMPAAYYRQLPDISLYDHDRMAAALAAVLESSTFTEQQLKTLVRSAHETDEPMAVLVGGDLSGVQDFIYTITSRGAASALRGRSFYLQLLTEVVARYVLAELGLPITNLVYAGGGNFYLLARPNDIEPIVEIQRQVSQTLLYHHRGDLYLAIDCFPLKGKQFYNGEISRAWGQLNEQLQRAKQRRFVELGAGIASLFIPQGHGGNKEELCVVCGREHPQTKEDPKSRGEGEEKVRKCPQCLSYEALGEDLRRAEYLILSRLEQVKPPHPEEEPIPGAWEAVLACFGWQAQLGTMEEGDHVKGSARQIVLALSERALQQLPHPGQAAVGRRLLVNVTPTITQKEIKDLHKRGLTELPASDSVKPFHALEAQSDGIERLGVLRMDVDNLGRLFSDGFGRQATLSRVAALSFAISLYFEGWVEILAKQMNKEDVAVQRGERLYSIYSGGDDLFFVGAWDAVIELARHIRADLEAYTAGHPGIHASAGMVLVSGKYPLYQAAEDAHAALEQAKHLEWVDGTQRRKKDAISFLGQALPWKVFGLEGCSQGGTNSAHALMHLLIAKEQGGSATPLVRRLIGLHERYAEVLEKRRKEGLDLNRGGQEQTLYGPWNWLGFYSLSRLYRQRRDEKIRQLRDRLKEDNFRSIEWIGLAARWAELRLRKHTEKENNALQRQ